MTWCYVLVPRCVGVLGVMVFCVLVYDFGVTLGICCLIDLQSVFIVV